MKYLSLIVFTFVLMVSCSGEKPTESVITSSPELQSYDTVFIDSVDFPMALSFDAVCAILEEYSPDVASLDSIFNLYELSKENFSQFEKDSACILYVGHMHKITSAVEEEDRDDTFEDMKSKFEPYGFAIGSGEGFLWLIVNTDVAGVRFGDDLSSSTREFMRLGEITGRQYSADAGMLISYDEWADILIDLEERTIENQESPYINNFLYAYQNFLTTFMYGQDNTPALSWGDEKKFNDDVMLAYQKLLDDDNHKTGLFIQEHIDRMEESNFEMSWEERWTPSFDLIKDHLELNQ